MSRHAGGCPAVKAGYFWSRNDKSRLGYPGRPFERVNYARNSA